MKALKTPHRAWTTGLLVLVVACAQSDDRPAHWSYIHEAILKPSCATVSCHSNENAQARLRLHTRGSAYLSLVGLPCSDRLPDRGGYLVPGDSDSSYLLALLRGDDERFVVVMPPDRLLPSADVELVAEWVDRGAPCD